MSTQKFLVAEQVSGVSPDHRPWQVVGYITKLPKRWMVSDAVEETGEATSPVILKAAKWLHQEIAKDVVLEPLDGRIFRVTKA